ncbi:unnamed protein product, partial [Mesorhabditis spiculigera]
MAGLSSVLQGYPRNIGGYAFEFVTPPAALEILRRGRALHLGGNQLTHIPAFAKDSQHVTDDDRKHLVEIIQSHPTFKKILITHGTDTMIETAKFLRTQSSLQDRIIVLTGSMTPAVFRDSDADFNIGMAWSAVQSLKEPGAYLAIQGIVANVENVERNLETGQFLINP